MSLVTRSPATEIPIADFTPGDLKVRLE